MPFLLLLILLSLSFNATAAPNPWANDPLAKVNLFSSSNGAKPTTSENKVTPKTCPPVDKCPVCEVVEEWPLDFDGDDLAEKAEKRQCNFDPALGFKPQVVIIYDSQMSPLIYKSNTANCKENKNVLYSTMQRVDFNGDNFDELLLVEHDEEKQSDAVSILGYNATSRKIAELPIVEYETDLKDKLRSNIASDELKVTFERLNGTIGFILNCLTPSQRSFQVYYFQDSADRGFYPLRILEKRKRVLATTQAPQVQGKAPSNGAIEFIE